MNRMQKISRLVRAFNSYKRGHSVLPYLPLRLWIETTNYCNLRCKVCPNATDTTSKRGNMDWNLYKSIIGQLKGKANDINLSHRGEPLFHPELERMIILARKAGINTRIHTNATMLNSDRAAMLMDAKPDLISFSFDGYDKETYESIRIGGCFEITYRNILGFLKRKLSLASSKPYTIVQIIMPEDADLEYKRKLHSMGSELQRWGLDKFYIKKPHNWAGNAPGEINSKTGFTPCTFLYYSMTILWDGTVCPCPQDWYASMIMGDANTQPLEQIWNGEPMKNLRRRMQRRDLEGLLCHQCDRVFRPSCMGIPTENVKAFFGETLAGYDLVRKIVRR